MESPDEVYRKIAEEYGAALARLAYVYEADPDLRRDLIQEIHLALWRKFSQVRYEVFSSNLDLPSST